MSDKSSENNEMSDVAAASRMLHENWSTGSVKERIRAAARALRWTNTRTRDLWYAQARRVDAHEMQRLATFKSMRELARDHVEQREADHERDELNRALALAASHLALAASQGDRAAAHALRQITSHMDMAGGV